MADEHPPMAWAARVPAYRDELDSINNQLRERIHDLANRTNDTVLEVNSRAEESLTRARVLETTVMHHGESIKRLDEALGRLATRDQIVGLQQTFESWDKKMVTQDQFSPVRMIIYGMVALILMAVVGALVALVIIRPVPGP
jgi:ABC-type multidrug transport system fused ATPase/permease subunit